MAPGPIDDLIWWVAQLLDQLLGTLGEGIDWILQWVVAMLDDLMAVVWDMIGGILTTIGEGLMEMFKAIEDTLVAILDSVWAFLEEAWATLEELTVGILDSITNYISDIWAELEAWIAGILDRVAEAVSDTVQWVKDVADAAMRELEALARRIGDMLADIATPILNAVNEALERAMATINAAWEQFVLGAEAIINAINEKLVGLKEAFVEAALEIVAKVGEVSDDVLGPLKETVKEFTDAYMPSDDPSATQRALVALKGIHTDPTSMANYRAWWTHEAERLGEAGMIKKAIYLTLFFLASFVPTVMGISQVLSQPVIQEYSRMFPFQVLAPADASGAWRREMITRGEAVGEIRRAGFDERKAGFIADLGGTVPAVEDLTRMLWREIIPPQEFDKGLTVHGIDDPWRKRMRDAAKLIPGVQDLVHFAVRDVWNPEAVAQGKLYEAFPEELAEWAEKQGLALEWARKYWAAHWRLPSILQAFEMRHRDEIGDSELDTLLQALDVAPGWRDPLKAIAFHPYTRVDIRRMHRIGVLDDDQILRAYKDLGYDQEKAEGLRDFTIVLNEPKGIEDDEELGKLSRVAVLGFYEDGLLGRERAQELLQTAGHTPEAALLYLDATDASEERSERKTETALIIELAQAGSIGWDEAEDRLRALGLETKEVERAVTRLLRARQRTTKLPSKSDADAFLVAGLVQPGEYEDLLGRLGYSPKWTALYLKLAQVKRAKG